MDRRCLDVKFQKLCKEKVCPWCSKSSSGKSTVIICHQVQQQRDDCLKRVFTIFMFKTQVGAAPGSGLQNVNCAMEFLLQWRDNQLMLLRLDARRVKKVAHKKFGVESPEVHESIFNTQNRCECPSKNQKTTDHAVEKIVFQPKDQLALPKQCRKLKNVGHSF